VLRNKAEEIERRMKRAVMRFNLVEGIWPDQDAVVFMWSYEDKVIIPPIWNTHAGRLE
jgi:hypothetical protein